FEIARDAEAEIVPAGAAVIAKRHAELGCRRAAPARSSDDAEAAALRAERIDRLLRARVDDHLVVVLRPLGDIPADIEEPERVRRKATDRRRDLKAVVVGDERRAEHLRSEEHTSELQSREYNICRLLLEK